MTFRCLYQGKKDFDFGVKVAYSISMLYLILKSEAELDKRWLAITKLGDLWTEESRATRFEDEAKAIAESAKRECTRVIWWDTTTGQWGDLT